MAPDGQTNAHTPQPVQMASSILAVSFSLSQTRPGHLKILVHILLHPQFCPKHSSVLTDISNFFFAFFSGLRQEESDAVFREIDGRKYFLTGDIGHIDDNGYVTITDRKKDLILVGGFNCYPREVEEILYTHPKVANAAVVGVPDPKSGEAVKAFIELKEGEEATEQEILDFCKDNMAGYKRPRSIELRDELPTSVIGKVLRRVLRDEEISKGQ